MIKYKSEIVDIIENYLLTNDINKFNTTKRSDIRKWLDENYDDKNKSKLKEKVVHQWFY